MHLIYSSVHFRVSHISYVTSNICDRRDIFFSDRHIALPDLERFYLFIISKTKIYLVEDQIRFPMPVFKENSYLINFLLWAKLPFYS